MLEYESLNDAVFCKIPVCATNILDVGCGTGNLGRALKKQKEGRVVYGVTYSQEEYKKASNALDKVVIGDINNNIPLFDIKFDSIIFSHILEHTYDPIEVLKKFSTFLNENGSIVIALPNVLYYKQRFEFLKGNFIYSLNGGLMDITHFRFFDWLTAQELVKKAGLRLISKEATGIFPSYKLRKIMPSFCKFIDKKAVKYFPGLFGFQFVFVAKV